MATIGSFMKELAHISKYAGAQAAAGVDKGLIAKSQFEVVMKRINALTSLDYEQASDLVAAITANSTKSIGWSESQVLDLTVAVNTRLNRGSSKGTAAKRVNQECDTIELYFTTEEVAELSDPSKSARAKIAVVRKRFQELGIHCASEKLKGRVAQLINEYSGVTEMDANEWYRHLQLVKKALSSLKKLKWDHEYIVDYQRDPRELPAPVFAAAYPAGTAPGMKSAPGATTPPDFLRSSAAPLRPDSASKKGVVMMTPQSNFDLSPMLNVFGRQLADCLRQQGVRTPDQQPQSSSWRMQYSPEMPALADARPGTSPRPSWPVAGTHGPPRVGSSSPSSLAASPTVPESSVVVDEEDDVDGAELTDEEALLVAVMKRPAAALPEDAPDAKAKKAEASTTAKAKAATAKKLAAKAEASTTAKAKAKAKSATIKRPAAAVPPLPKDAPPAPRGSEAKPPPTITYKGAKIYTSWKRRAYRCVVDPAVSPSDLSFAWKSHGSHTAAWAACIAKVNSVKS